MIPATLYRPTSEDSSRLQRCEAGCDKYDSRPYEYLEANAIRSRLTSTEDPFVHEQNRYFRWPGHCFVESLRKVPPEKSGCKLMVCQSIAVHAVAISDANDNSHGQHDG